MITVSVVSHGQGCLLQGLIADLARSDGSLHWPNRLVITHNIPEKEAACAGALASRCHVIVNAYPKGFGANHNAAFAHCQTEWFAVLNPDIRLHPGVFERLISHARPEDVVLAPALVDPVTGLVAANRGLPTPWEIFRRRFPGWHQPEVAAWFPGAFLLIRAEAFRRVGGFDERYFLYGEDVDLCARLRLAGGSLRYVPELQVSHAAQRSSHVRWRYLRWHMASLLRLWTSATFWRYRALLRCEQREKTQAAQRPR